VSLVIHIQHLKGSLAGRSHRLLLEERQPLRLGRNPDSNVKFTDEDDDCVSGVHAELLIEGGRLLIADARSSNGTFVNGALCPPFQRIEVPDGSRIRLARNGPEMEVTIRPKSLDGSRQSDLTAQREINADEVFSPGAGELVSVHRRARRWAIGTASAALLLAGAGIGSAIWWNQRQIERSGIEIAQRVDAVTANRWADIARHVSSSVVHVRCTFRIHIPVAAAAGEAGAVSYREVLLGSAVEGSGVIVGRGLILTAEPLAEPWRAIFPHWQELAGRGSIRADYELVAELPGQPPIPATLVAGAADPDLALLQVRQVAAPAVPIMRPGRTIGVADRVAIVGYRAELGRRPVEIRSRVWPAPGKGSLVQEQPAFALATIDRPLSASNTRFTFDAVSSERRCGGAVLDEHGELIGIVAQPFTTGRPILVAGRTIAVRVPGRAAGVAASPQAIYRFLHRRGIERP